MAYRFPLAAVLRVRESIEKREERALQQLQTKVSQLSQKLDELDLQQRSILDLRLKAIERSIAAVHLHSLEQSLIGLTEYRQALTKELQVATEQRDRQMLLYMASHRDRELLTDMFVKSKEIYGQESDRREQSRLDDLFNYRGLAKRR
ncbi:hypothetical protein DYQ86_00125 [Acidobacteria bacterium AB60]|nr:hypothetical protein DYQ86_00125 [Acidobacteria bacterium AB60]